MEQQCHKYCMMHNKYKINRQCALQNRILLSDIPNDSLDMYSYICYCSCLINFYGGQLILPFCECGNVKLCLHHSYRLCDIKSLVCQHNISKNPILHTVL